MTILVSYHRGRAKVYLSDGRQSPELHPDQIRTWVRIHVGDS